MKKITICGATGFIGINLVRKFSKKYKVYAIYNKQKPFSLKNVKWVKADLRNYKDCLKVTSLSKIIIQAAATTSGSKDIINNPFLHVTDNAIMNSYLLKASYVNSIEKFIVQSTSLLKKLNANLDIINFGHLGDNNLHFNVFLDENLKPYEYKVIREKIVPY